VLKIFCSNSKHTKRRDGNILRLVLPSLLSVALCLACLAGTTWAWFTSTVSGNVATLNAARFSCTIEVQQMDVSVEPHVPVGDPLTQRAYRDGDEDVPAIFEFDYNSSYQVTITPDDESTASQGYCLVSFMDAEKNLLVYHTQKIAKDGTFTFTYENGIPDGLDLDELADLLAQEDKLTFVAYWGEYIPAAAGFMKAAGREISGMKNGAVIGLPPVQLPVTTTYKLGDHIALEDETLRDGTRCIVLRAAEGYALPETIEVTINKQAYSVYTAGERIDGQPWFDFENSTLFIPGGLLKPGYTRSIMVTIQAEAVAVAVPEITPTPEASPAPTTEPTESQPPYGESTPEASPAPTTEPTESQPPYGESTSEASPAPTMEPIESQPSYGESTPEPTPNDEDAGGGE